MPTAGNPSFESIMTIQRVADAHKCQVQLFKAFPTTLARNMLVEEFLKTEATHLFFCDDDVILPDDVLERLLALDSDIAKAAMPFLCKQNGHTGIYIDLQKKPNDFWEEPWPCGQFPINRCGTAALLVKRHVFEKVEYPWFQYFENREGGMMSEDVVFSDKAREAGCTMMADGDAHLGHLKRVDLSMFCPGNGESLDRWRL